MAELGYRLIRDEILERISRGEWAPGSLLPAEADLAKEYDCARGTVNRALQSLAEEGIIERKRRAGTRVKALPARKAKFEIPIIRLDVESTGAVYKPKVILRRKTLAPAAIVKSMRLRAGTRALHLQTMHLASGRPYAFEDRWVNLKAVPDILNAPLDEISANEWLVRYAPYSSGEVSFSAASASEREASMLQTPIGSALFAVDRMTWLGEVYITFMKLYYKPGYKMRTNI
ncbi:MAG: GntR family transcriptional regulator [Hyphococcus sp.]|nr:MAG: GntR family transcriptional regulator [Marinicaulis sp.]